MHQQIRHNLEDYLRGEEKREGSVLPAAFHAHLGECAECAIELQSLQAQSQLLRSLRIEQSVAEGVEPRAGFYARVMERIEAQPASIWAAFLDRKFGFRLAVASAALVALLGTYLVTSETNGPEFASSPTVVLTDTPRSIEGSVSQDGSLRERQQRNAVLVDLASYRQ
jgi:anti-sigma factor RsiW